MVTCLERAMGERDGPLHPHEPIFGFIATFSIKQKAGVNRSFSKLFVLSDELDSSSRELGLRQRDCFWRLARRL